MIVLPNLPYKKDALEPYISEKTVGFHYEKHHAGYVNKLNDLIKNTDNTDFKNGSLEDIIILTHSKQDAKSTTIFNNAAQVWNHTFYWQSMKSKDEFSCSDKLMEQIKKDYGNIDILRDKLSEYAVQQFGSGWTWLILNSNSGKLEICNTSNADTPIVNSNTVPLLAIDVWEHAYYLDYQNRRLDYVKEVLQNLVNWKFASDNYIKASK